MPGLDAISARSALKKNVDSPTFSLGPEFVIDAQPGVVLL